MKIKEPTAQGLESARSGDMAALDDLLAGIQPAVFNLAVRVLGNREDAADSTQEILLKVVTHLGSYRGSSAFGTWVWSIAHNHLLSARTRSAEWPVLSLEALGAKLGKGMALAETLDAAGDTSQARVLTPEDKLHARQVAVSCTQQMLMALDRDQRLAYVMNTVFDTSSSEAAAVLGVTPEAYRQRLSRAKSRLEPFMSDHCGLVGADAGCRCNAQARVLQRQAGVQAAHGGPQAMRTLRVEPAEWSNAHEAFDAFERVAEAAAVIRRTPALLAPDSMRAAIRAVLVQEGFMLGRPAQ